MASVTYTVTFELLTCGKCGIQFAVPNRWLEERQEDHQSWYCPNGHGRAFLAESREEKLARELSVARQQIARAEDETADERRLRRAAEKKLRRQTGRVSAGVCPCCNRTFQQLARHMASKHPNVATIKEARDA